MVVVSFAAAVDMGFRYGIIGSAKPGQENFTPGTSTQTISKGYHDGTGKVEGDADLVPGNIKYGVNIFGVEGVFTGTYTVVYARGAVVQTGQTTQYSSKEDDGYNEKGLALDYTDNGDGTVTDKNTGLMWEQKTAGNKDHKYTWSDAFDNFIDNEMNGGSGYAGYTDWRLPNMKELFSLVKFEGASGPYIDKANFPNTVSSNYWTSTTYAPYTGRAVNVNFNRGLVYYADKTTVFRVRAVRGGP
ncbi:MAG: DUF1566 domain-containing protein [Elusimicrobiota bacterium]